jgi:Myb-like DNA-binding domain
MQGNPRKRSRPHEELELDLTGLHDEAEGLDVDPHAHHRRRSNLIAPGRGMDVYNPNPQQHHHHHLPEHSPKRMRGDPGDMGASTSDYGGPPSVVGQAGMPAPAPRPRGPKLKFTAEDDALLVDLKENKTLTWKQIAEFFPGRSSGTLQVRYCTKLKAKTTQWTDETVCSEND